MCKWITFLSSVNHSRIPPTLRSVDGNLWSRTGWSEVQVALDLQLASEEGTVFWGQALVFRMWCAPVKVELQPLAVVLSYKILETLGGGIYMGEEWVLCATSYPDFVVYFIFSACWLPWDEIACTVMLPCHNILLPLKLGPGATNFNFPYVVLSGIFFAAVIG